MFSRAALTIVTTCLVLGACTNVVNQPPSTTPDPTSQGVTVLCEDGTGPGVTASIVIDNLQTGAAIPAIINPNTATAAVCGIVNTTAGNAGFTTQYSGSNATGLEIFGPPAKIQIKCKEITLELQTFQPPPQGVGPITDCPQ